MAKVRPLNDVLQKAAIEQLNEVPERIPDDIEALRTWINQQPHLNARTDDQFLLIFLRGCKFSLEKAKRKIEKYYTMRSKYPEMLTCYDVDDPKIREILRLGITLCLPTPLNENGPIIFMYRFNAYSPHKHTIEDVLRVLYMMLEIIMLENDFASIYGFIFISQVTLLEQLGANLGKATAAHMFQLTPSLLKKAAVFVEEAIPLRIKGNNFLNTFAAFEPVFNMGKPMLSQKQQNGLFVHGNKMDSLYEQIPKIYLPKEYGGDNGAIDEIIATWERKFDEFRDHFKQNANFVTNEKMRPGKPIDFDNIFGIEGSFRKINVD